MMGVCISQYKNNQTKKKNMKQSYDINNNDENFNGNMKMVLPYKTETPVLPDTTNLEDTTVVPCSIPIDNENKEIDEDLIKSEILTLTQNNIPPTELNNTSLEHNCNSDSNEIHHKENNHKSHLDSSNEIPKVNYYSEELQVDLRNGLQNTKMEEESYYASINENTCIIEDISDHENDEIMDYENDITRTNYNNNTITTSVKLHDDNGCNNEDFCSDVMDHNDSSDPLNASINVGDVDVEDLE